MTSVRHPQGSGGAPPFDLRHFQRAVSTADGLTWRERCVLLHLSTYADHRTGRRVRPGIERLSAETGIEARNLKACLAALRRAGWLYPTNPGGGAGRATEYGLRIGSHSCVLADYEDAAPRGTVVETTTVEPKTVVDLSRNGGQSDHQTVVDLTTPSLRIDQDRSSSGVGDPRKGRPRGEEEEPQTPTEALAGAWPIRRRAALLRRPGVAQENATEALTEILAGGVPLDDVLAAVIEDSSITAEVWPDAWLRERARGFAGARRAAAAAARQRAIDACDLCGPDGRVEVVDPETGRLTGTAACSHGRDSLRAAG